MLAQAWGIYKFLLHFRLGLDFLHFFAIFGFGLGVFLEIWES